MVGTRKGVGNGEMDTPRGEEKYRSLHSGSTGRQTGLCEGHAVARLATGVGRGRGIPDTGVTVLGIQGAQHAQQTDSWESREPSVHGGRAGRKAVTGKGKGG